MNSAIRKNSVVTVTYVLLDGKGSILEERNSEQPLEYIHGYDQILPALEKALEGQTVGYQGTFRVPPREGFGEYDADLAAEMSRAEFPPEIEVKAGMKFNTIGPSGEPLVVRVIEVSGDKVLVDGNHPLAGLSLVFEVRILDVRDALQEEIERAQLAPDPTQLH